MKARKDEWEERQRSYAAEVKAERDHLKEEKKEFHERPHGSHLLSALGFSW